MILFKESMLDITDVSSNFGESMESASVAGPLTSATSTTCSKISVDISMMYNPLTGNLAVRIVELRNLNAAARYSNCVQLRLLLLPERKQRHKTKIRYVNASDVTVMDTVVFDRFQNGIICSTLDLLNKNKTNPFCFLSPSLSFLLHSREYLETFIVFFPCSIAFMNAILQTSFLIIDF